MSDAEDWVDRLIEQLKARLEGSESQLLAEFAAKVLPVLIEHKDLLAQLGEEGVRELLYVLCHQGEDAAYEFILRKQTVEQIHADMAEREGLLRAEAARNTRARAFVTQLVVKVLEAAAGFLAAALAAL
jgi:hypothetical protein